jgi:hypothetical protein
VTQLVNQRLANRHHNVILIVACVLDGHLKKRDLVGQRVAVGPLPLGQRRALIETKQRVRRLDADFGKLVVRRLILDDDGDVLESVRNCCGIEVRASSTSERNSLRVMLTGGVWTPP